MNHIALNIDLLGQILKMEATWEIKPIQFGITVDKSTITVIGGGCTNKGAFNRFSFLFCIAFPFSIKITLTARYMHA